jgi:hypothetical protein
VDGIYPRLTRFLPTESDPTTRLECSYATNQEGDVERGFGVLKTKFLVLRNPINYHHREDIYYMVLACILMHNMMVEARVHDGEQEDGSMYHTIDTVLGENDNNNASPIEEQPIDTRGLNLIRYIYFIKKYDIRL